jgi:hypothetical protein
MEHQVSSRHEVSFGGEKMVYDILALVAFLGGWFLLMKYVFPALGIPTCMSGACRLRKNQPEEKVHHDQ